MYGKATNEISVDYCQPSLHNKTKDQINLKFGVRYDQYPKLFV